MTFDPFSWGEKTLTAAVQLKLKSAVQTTLICTFSFILLIFSPLLTEEYFVRPIVTFVLLAVLVAMLVGAAAINLYRSWRP